MMESPFQDINNQLDSIATSPRRQTSPKSISGLNHRVPRFQPPPPQSIIGDQVVIKTILDKVKDFDISIQDEVKKLTNLLSIYRKIDTLKSLPCPIENVEIPSSFVNLISDPRKYATQFPSYMEIYNELKTEYYTEVQRKNTLLSGFGFLYNASHFTLDSSESTEDFYQRCEDKAADTLLDLRMKAERRDITLEAYINETDF